MSDKWRNVRLTVISPDGRVAARAVSSVMAAHIAAALNLTTADQRARLLAAEGGFSPKTDIQGAASDLPAGSSQ